MFTQDFLKQIEDAIYQPYFMEGILTLHKDRIEAGEYRIEIRDYNKGLEVLIPTLSDDEKNQFAEFEELCQAIQKQYALHGFLAGVYAGFRHAFTGAREVDAGYDKYVMNEVMMLPNIKPAWIAPSRILVPISANQTSATITAARNLCETITASTPKAAMFPITPW